MSKQNNLEDAVDEFSQGMIREKSSIEGAADVLFDDKTDPKTNLSSIDLRTRLAETQIKNISVADELSKLGVIPSANSFTRNIKRLNVSINGEGRKELVQLASGVMQQEQGMGFMDKMKGMFTGGNNQ